MKIVMRVMVILTMVGGLLACSSTQQGAGVDKNSRLVVAAEKGNTDEVERLIHAGADINTTNKSGFTPYMLASNNGHFKTMKALEKAGAKRIAMDPRL